MDSIHFGENIAKLRRDKKITQEQLAAFMGVTKASVSKWETKQSMPDVTLLPQIASFFDVTIDELLGYEPRLSKEQIQKIYMDFTQDFAKEEFEVVMNKTRELVKKYYSCHEFLVQIVCLWMNHYMLHGGNQSTLILEEAKSLCEHIIEDCKDISLCNDVVLLKTNIDLQLGNAPQVIQVLEEIYDPCRLSTQGEGVLISAYLQAGEKEKANDFTQMSMYQHLLALVSEAAQYLMIHKDNLIKCEETLQRITELARAYNIEKINFNVMAIFHYHMAIIYCLHDKKIEAIQQLERFVKLTDHFLCYDKSHLKSDNYFDRLDRWFEKILLSGNLPRDKKVIYDGMVLSFENALFEILKEEPEYQKLKKLIESRGEMYESNH